MINKKDEEMNLLVFLLNIIYNDLISLQVGHIKLMLSLANFCLVWESELILPV